MGSFVFPFAVAQQALGSMEDLAARLRSVVNAHNDALATAHQDFAGETRDQFDRDFSTAMDTLLAYAGNLDAQAESLRSTIATARYLDALSQAPASTP